MKPLPPDFPVIASDWLSSPSIAVMTPAEEGAYFRLLCYAWTNEHCCLPDDDAALAQLSRLGDAWGQGSGAKIRKCFDVDPGRPGFIFNQRQRETRLDQMLRVTTAREQRSLAAKARWAKTGASVGSSQTHPPAPGNNSAPPEPIQNDAPRAANKAADSKSERREKAKAILNHLNQQAGRNYSPVDAHLRLIAARLSEVGDDVPGVCQMIDRKCAEWKGDPKMDHCLRPSTLFRQSNFQGYFDERNLPVISSAKTPSPERKPGDAF